MSMMRGYLGLSSVDAIGLHKLSENGFKAFLNQIDKCNVVIMWGHTSWITGRQRAFYRAVEENLTEDEQRCFAFDAVSCRNEAINRIDKRARRSQEKRSFIIGGVPRIRKPLPVAESVDFAVDTIEEVFRYLRYHDWCGRCRCRFINLAILCQPHAAKVAQELGGEARGPSLIQTVAQLCGDIRVNTSIGRRGAWESFPIYLGENTIDCEDLKSLATNFDTYRTRDWKGNEREGSVRPRWGQ